MPAIVIKVRDQEVSIPESAVKKVTEGKHGDRKIETALLGQDGSSWKETLFVNARGELKGSAF